MFAVLVTGKEARSSAPGNRIMGAEDQKHWAMRDPDGWVEASSTPCDDETNVPAGAKTFLTRVEAEEFGARWKGHPWWCVPKSFEVVPVEPKMKSVPDGYRRIG